jgi:hemin uptake protein HemP
MSEDTLRAVAGELDAEEILSALDDGRRVVVSVDRFGTTYDVTLRHDGRQYYCDTPTTLHRHEDREEMRRCITEQGYIRDLQATEAEDGEAED